ncbi:hypothetical protein [Brazilian marseillevirus]|nr:hypothetical protein A3303_gp477 [Brazilian marseillevirus]AMQ10985.1 hypothetical protein [Brazilian marseillevirus]
MKRRDFLGYQCVVFLETQNKYLIEKLAEKKMRIKELKALIADIQKLLES